MAFFLEKQIWIIVFYKKWSCENSYVKFCFVTSFCLYALRAHAHEVLYFILVKWTAGNLILR